MTDLSAPLRCLRCGATYTDDEFRAANPGPYVEQALKAAKVTQLASCGRCPPTVLDRSRPEA